MQDDFRPVSRPPQSGMAEPPAQNTHRPPTQFLPPPKKRGFHKLADWFRHLSKKQKIILFSVLAGLLITSALIWWFVIRKPAPPAKTKKPETVKKEAPKPTTVASRLTGVQIPPELNELPTTGVMIENSPDARPQSGLLDAGVIYEAIAEGGITRFLALFLEGRPDYLGPVRSVRPYFLDFVVPYDAPLAHAGGSAQALAQIRSEGLKDLDHGANAAAFERVSSRFAPHNLYTSRNKLLDAQVSRGYNTSTFTGFERKEKEEKAATPQARTIDFAISSALYNVHYDYNADCNCYPRSEGGTPHVDERSGQPYVPKVVIALVMPHTYAGIYSVYGTTGVGQMFVFQEGKVLTGTWTKPNRQTQFTFKDANDKPLKLTPGQTWITLVSSPGAVTYQP